MLQKVSDYEVITLLSFTGIVRNKSSLLLKIFFILIYNYNYLQNIQLKMIKSDIKNAKTKSMLSSVITSVSK